MKIAEHIHWRKGSCCTYLIDDGTIIDPGMFNFEGILELLAEAELPLSGLKRIFLTHSHRDHASLAAELKRNTNAAVYSYADSGSRTLRKSLCTDLTGVVDELLEEGSVLPILGGAKVLYTPGHTMDHISLYLEKEKILFSGDALQVKNGILCMAPKGLNYDNTLAEKSYARLMSLDCVLLCPGHREPISKP